MDNSEVAIAAIALAGTAIAGVIWTAKYFARTLSQDLKEHTKAAVEQRVASQDAALASREQAQASQKSAYASQQMLTFMKALNGRLSKITQQVVDEQTVHHQTVEKESHKE